MSIYNLTTEFVKNMFHLYLEKCDFESLFKMIDESVSWIGTGENDIYTTFAQALDILKKERASLGGKLEITDEWYSSSEISEYFSFVYGELKIKQTNSQKPDIDLNIRFSVVCKTDKNDVKVLHTHTSIPYINKERGLANKSAQGYTSGMKKHENSLDLQLQSKKSELESILSHIRCGVKICRSNAEFSMLYINEGLCEMIGYTIDEIKEKFHNSYIHLISHSSLNGLAENLYSQLQEKNSFSLEYQLVRKDGSSIWVLDNGGWIELENGEMAIHSVMTDITQIKQIQQKLYLYSNKENDEQEKQQEINSVEELYYKSMFYNVSSIYQCNLTKNKFIPNNVPLFETLGIKPTDDYSFVIDIFIRLSIHPDDIAKCRKYTNREYLLNLYKSGTTMFSFEYRKKEKDGNMNWYSANLHMLENPKTLDIMMFGYIQNIQERKLKEQELLYKSQYDGLTGVYNKSTIETTIVEYLSSQEGKNGTHAFFILDIDRFKSINDNFGHSFGDEIVVDVANKIKCLFRESDILGRVGGDEFGIFIKNIPNETTVRAKAEQILNTIRKSYPKDDKTFTISVSIGIAFYQFPQTYNELYINSDTALYKAKSLGRDTLVIYKEEDE